MLYLSGPSKDYCRKRAVLIKAIKRKEVSVEKGDESQTTCTWEWPRCMALHPIQFSSIAQSWPTLQPHEFQHARPVHHQLQEFTQTHVHRVSDAIQPSQPLSSPSQSLPASESFPISQLSASGHQSIGVSASTSVPPMNTQDW